MISGRARQLLASLGLAVGLFAAAPAISVSQTSQAAEPGDERNGNETPVVVILFDELPTASLMTRDGRDINARRFPEIASFASGATWYRDNVAAGDFTAWAVPGVLTGNTINPKSLPVAADHPDNLFTVLGPGRQVHSLETVTEFCPVEICPDGHQGEGAGAEDAFDFVKLKFEPYAPGAVKDWIDGIPPGSRTLSFAHIELPHQPLRFVPTGQAYKPGPLIMPTDRNFIGWTTREPAVTFVQHRHLIQTGYADRLVGKILDRIRENGDFNDAMIVLTADHGISFDPDDWRRDVSGTNTGATVNPPLIIKYPGQQVGKVSTASTQNLDIYPTIADRLGAVIPPVDGQPVDEADDSRVMTVIARQSGTMKVTAKQIRRDRKGVIADQYRRLGNGDLWHLGPQSDLIGQRTRASGALAGSRYGLYVSEQRIRKADSSANFVPSLISGPLTGVEEGQVLALSWNGKIAATTRSFRFQGKVRFGVMVPPSVMTRGRNRIGVFAVGSVERLLRIRPAR